jgi:hypothetical protein
MPLNYLELQPQLRDYAQKSAAAREKTAAQREQLLAWLNECAGEPRETLRQHCRAFADERCALPAGEAVNQYFSSSGSGNCLLLAADGSQIVPSAHDAVPLALVNTSLVILDTASGQAPVIRTESAILDDFPAGVEFDLLSEDLINLKRDVAELDILVRCQASQDLPVIALRDGPLELYHEPRQGRQFQPEFERYIAAMQQLAQKDFSLAGYIDRSQSTTITQMLYIFKTGQPLPKEQKTLPDVSLMEALLPPGRRSAVFEMQSTSSKHYGETLRVHFFYLNVGRPEKAYIVRVEIPAWVAGNPEKVERLQIVLLEQCRIMGSRPYPYLLHRAHEEAVVHYDEKEQLQRALLQELQNKGMHALQPSNKLAAKMLQTRTRM